MDSLLDPLEAIHRAGESKPSLFECVEHLVEVRRGLRVCMIHSFGSRAGSLKRQQAWTGNIMEELQAFQAAALEGGFIAAEESKDGTVLWFRKATPDPSTSTHQRMCLDSLTKSATVFWANARGQTDSKTFRSVATLREWISGILVAG